MGAMHSRFGPHLLVSHRHHCSGPRNKLIFLGVTLWLTSTVIAGVRRSTGLTHKSLVSEETKRRQEYLRLMNARFRQSQGLPEQQQQLEKLFVDAASSDAERQERRMWVERERELISKAWMAQGLEVPAAEWAERKSCYGQRHGGGGLARWYLGVGERTFDWVVRRIQGSPSFQIEDRELRRTGSGLGPRDAADLPLKQPVMTQ
ncbi:hypothetical protein J3B02_000228 [Coemansia erecta]|uniref:Uncharacterized protein n=1 Tax=Coemansia asiatica TaxID=1052880 RepID=A0A9W7XL00_9FUNG|nr:hypothetical protein LPJ64_003824 [Coemansia asiatica]KAJ2858478.1 hypothetical protein J3B02_000228 [Coemansia erecta]KAJ2886336.1 hypothetical protein FB639_001597 [Coemansia asiatica]